MEQGNVTDHPSTGEPIVPEHHPVFTGSGGEYFRVWIVNILLSLVTLGIYSAWATVRNRRYLYGNTDLDGHRFDFHGDPVAILKGRIIAVTLLLVYLFGGDLLHWSAPLIAFAVFLAGFPWLVVLSMRFRLANSSYRNLRFGFTASTAVAYRRLGPVMIGGAVVAGLFTWGSFDVLTGRSEEPHPGTLLISTALGLMLMLALVPMFNHRLRDLVMNHVRFGSQRVTADLQLGAFWAALGLAIAWGVLAIVAAFVVAFIGGMIAAFSGSMTVMFIVIYALMVPAYLAPFAVWHARVMNHVFSQARAGDVRFSMHMNAAAYWWILVSNAVVAVLTMGLAIPWAKVRSLRYHLSCLGVTGDLDSFRSGERSDPTALGDEIGGAFDIELGF